MKTLEQQNQELKEAGQKLLGIILNIRHETDYLPDHYYDWMDQVISETDEILADEDPVAIPNGGVDKEEPFQYFSVGTDPYTDLVNTGNCSITHKIVDGQPVCEYNGRSLDIKFPNLMKDMLKYYDTQIVKERTDEDIMMELKAINLFKPEVLKEFIDKHYGK